MVGHGDRDALTVLTTNLTTVPDELKPDLQAGIDSINRALEFWNYRDKWTRYGSHGYLSPPHYHKLNGVLLTALAKVTGNTVVARYAEMWGTEKLSRLDRAEIFLAFVMTKNWARLRLPRG